MAYTTCAGNATSALTAAEKELDRISQAISRSDDATRIRLLWYEVLTSAAGTGLAMGGLIAGVFGMNVSNGADLFDNTVNNLDVFGGVVCFIVLASFGLFALLILVLFSKQISRYLRKTCPSWKCLRLRKQLPRKAKIDEFRELSEHRNTL